MVRGLTEYKKKRNFKKTPEPNPKVSTRKNKQIFVIQQHHASHMHYDFRLEMGGVLKSWAIPKGPSTDPRDKRLAALTEDHPLDYAIFEGIIPEGYGAGTVIVWDTGTYENRTEKDGKKVSMSQAFKDGHILIELHGKKLKGEYALIRFKGEERNWLFIKMKDQYADARRNPVKTEPISVLSNLTIKELDKKFKKMKKDEQ
jgi:DNA ligase D-like protein (predicted 3'-phosphoesterase)